ncbi:MAG: hypothetical protein ACI8TQ_003693 [Planctomycetota bacterium]|jgi:hypothetical protein
MQFLTRTALTAPVALLGLFTLTASSHAQLGKAPGSAVQPVRVGPEQTEVDLVDKGQRPFKKVTYEVSANQADPVPLAKYSGVDSDVHGPGGCWSDFNNDGWVDLYLPEDQSRNFLYINISDGNGGRKFRQQPFYLLNAPEGFQFLPTGAVAGDYDNDGDLDIYVTCSYKGLYSILGAPDCETEVIADNQLLRNRFVEDGVLRFEIVTASTDPTPGGLLDQHGLKHAFDVGLPGGIGEKLDDTVSAAWADVDRDGDLDLYVGNHDNHAQSSVPDPCDPLDKYGQRDILYLNLLGESEADDGTPHFVDVTLGPVNFHGNVYGGNWHERADPITGWQLPRNYETVSAGVSGWTGDNAGFETEHQRFASTNAGMFADLNKDQWPDLIVTAKTFGTDCRDRDMIYLNLGNDANGDWLGFEMITYIIDTVSDTQAPCDGFGSANGFGSFSPGAMGLDCADFDGDGDVDIFISDRGDSDLWENKMSDLGLPPGSIPVYEHSFETFIWGWGVRFDDYDNNGLLDLHVTTRMSYHDYMWMQTPGSTIGQGVKGQDMAIEMGVSQGGFFGPWVNSRANLTADYDNDGWLDVFVINRGAPPSSVFHNQLSDPDIVLPGPLAADTSSFNSMRLRLVGDTNVYAPTGLASTLDAVGALVKLTADYDGNGTVDPGELVYRSVHAGAGNAAGTSDMTIHFGLRRATKATIEVVWPSGRTTSCALTLADGASTESYTMFEGQGCP